MNIISESEKFFILRPCHSGHFAMPTKATTPKCAFDTAENELILVRTIWNAILNRKSCKSDTVILRVNLLSVEAIRVRMYHLKTRSLLYSWCRASRGQLPTTQRRGGRGCCQRRCGLRCCCYDLRIQTIPNERVRALINQKLVRVRFPTDERIDR